MSCVVMFLSSCVVMCSMFLSKQRNMDLWSETLLPKVIKRLWGLFPQSSKSLDYSKSSWRGQDLLQTSRTHAPWAVARLSLDQELRPSAASCSPPASTCVSACVQFAASSVLLCYFLCNSVVSCRLRLPRRSRADGNYSTIYSCRSGLYH